MPESEPNPGQTLALVFGASSFRRAPKLAQGRAFYNSAQDFHEYLTRSDGLGLPRENVEWLFDDSRSATDQLQDIRDFLENRTTALKNEGVQPQDLIVYYVGHGLFSGADNSYCLAIRATDERSEGLTSLRASDLASMIRASARFLRKFLILDCCFSAVAYKEFQSGPLTAGRVKLLEELPQRGTTLLCSASAQDPSLAPEGLSRTMFSDGLLRALHQGHPTLGPRLSLSELGDLVKLNIREAYPGNWVRPEVHSPDQREGDVAGVRLFPNPAWAARHAEKARQASEGKAREEAEAREGERKAQGQAEEAPHSPPQPSWVKEDEVAGRKALTENEDAFAGQPFSDAKSAKGLVKGFRAKTSGIWKKTTPYFLPISGAFLALFLFFGRYLIPSKSTQPASPAPVDPSSMTHQDSRTRVKWYEDLKTYGYIQDKPEPTANKPEPTANKAWAFSLIAVGILVFVCARQVSTLKSSAWARFYQRHPRAAEKNPLSVHAGTDRSIRLGAIMWRIVGAAIVLNGLIRLQ